MVGTLGGKIVFEVNDSVVQTFRDMNREVTGRWAIHEVPGTKPKAEYLGPGLQSISLSVYLSATLGVNPRRVLERIERMVENGEAEWFILGSKPVGRRPFRLIASSEAWDTIYSGGELAKATVNITLEEYA